MKKTIYLFQKKHQLGIEKNRLLLKKQKNKKKEKTKIQKNNTKNCERIKALLLFFLSLLGERKKERKFRSDRLSFLLFSTVDQIPVHQCTQMFIWTLVAKTRGFCIDVRECHIPIKEYFCTFENQPTHGRKKK